MNNPYCKRRASGGLIRSQLIQCEICQMKLVGYHVRINLFDSTPLVASEEVVLKVV